MYVTPESFEKHIGWLGDFITPVRLSTWIDRLAQGEPLPRRSVAITFDDGWHDNYTHAYPILKKHNIPATIFAVSGMIGTTRTFWPNRLSQLLSNQKFHTNWASGLEWLAEISPLKPHQLRSAEALSQVIHACKQLPDADIYGHLDAIQKEGIEGGDERTMLNWNEIAEMQNSGLVDIGCHTENHSRLLDTLSPELTEHEILSSKRALEERLNKTVDLFCYPNGDISPHAAKIVSSHYRAAVTTQTGINAIEQNLFELKRIGMHEDVSNSRSAFLARLSGWR